jgi:hypothetical protein
VETVTPTELANRLWGASEGQSRSSGARKVRAAARELYGAHYRRWHFTPKQVAEITERLTG